MDWFEQWTGSRWWLCKSGCREERHDAYVGHVDTDAINRLEGYRCVLTNRHISSIVEDRAACPTIRPISYNECPIGRAWHSSTTHYFSVITNCGTRDDRGHSLVCADNEYRMSRLFDAICKRIVGTIWRCLRDHRETSGHGMLEVMVADIKTFWRLDGCALCMKGVVCWEQ